VKFSGWSILSDVLTDMTIILQNNCFFQIRIGSVGIIFEKVETFFETNSTCNINNRNIRLTGSSGLEDYGRVML